MAKFSTLESETKSCYRFNDDKSKHRAFRKGNWKVLQKLFHTHYWVDSHSGIEDWGFAIFEKKAKRRSTYIIEKHIV